MVKKDTKPKEHKDEDKKRIEELEDSYKRALADYQNLEKRAVQQRLEWIKSANKELILRVLPVLDTLILAATHVDDETLRVSIKQFQDVLKAEGVEKIETVDKAFDPRTMECITTAEGEANKVLEEVRSGYLLNREVLRPAQVKVGEKL